MTTLSVIVVETVMFMKNLEGAKFIVTVLVIGVVVIPLVGFFRS